jgi:hypothetical protein
VSAKIPTATGRNGTKNEEKTAMAAENGQGKNMREAKTKIMSGNRIMVLRLHKQAHLKILPR